jgi:MFS family permease
MNTAPAIGPLLGALLLAFRGWVAVFWFMSIASGFCLLLVIFVLPETARPIVWNGSIAGPSAFHRLPISSLHFTASDSEAIREPKFRLPNPLKCLYVLRRKDTTITILSFSIFYMVYTCLQASLSSLFIQIYDLNQLQAGLIYLPFGVGCALAAFFAGTYPTLSTQDNQDARHVTPIGKLLDRDYRLTAHKHGFSTDQLNLTGMTIFPIAQARLRSISYPILTAIATIAGYGWCLEKKSVSPSH